MTLADLITQHPALFHAQAWYAGEAFLQAEPNTWTKRGPPRVAVRPPAVLPSAADLAALYVRTPTDPVWRRFLWTRDTDAAGQHIYVGGVSAANGQRFEIHRHLAIDSRWGYPTWG